MFGHFYFYSTDCAVINSFLKCFMVHSTKKIFDCKWKLSYPESNIPSHPERMGKGNSMSIRLLWISNCLVKINEIGLIKRTNAPKLKDVSTARQQSATTTLTTMQYSPLYTRHYYYNRIKSMKVFASHHNLSKMLNIVEHFSTIAFVNYWQLHLSTLCSKKR